MVLLLDSAGTLRDAMPYEEAQLGGGGRPLMRSDAAHCGGAANQHLWTEGMSPFRQHLPPTAAQSGWSDEAVLAEAQRPGRLVPRGPGMLDWYLGQTFDPVTARAARAWVGGVPADLQWTSDSVANLTWQMRDEAPGPLLEVASPVSLGPLRGCGPGSAAQMFTGDFIRAPSRGDVQVTGVLPDPVFGDPSRPDEAFALTNVSNRPLDLGPWSFGGARLRRQTILQPDSEVWLAAPQFEEWPGMSNAGGSMPFSLPLGTVVGEMAWDPCDHDMPSHVGSGMGLARSPRPGSDWQTAGPQAIENEEPLAFKGFGCSHGAGGEITGLDLYLNRHIGLLPSLDWTLEGVVGSAELTRLPGRSKVVRLHWEGMHENLAWPAGLSLCAGWGGTEYACTAAQCPVVGVDTPPPCLRVAEMMWNAHAEGAEFVELVNCGMVPLDISGLQASNAATSFPSDWKTWCPSDASLVLLPGDVAAFGICSKWMGNGLPEKGTARWTAENWRALNDREGQLSIRLPASSTEALDHVEWHPGLEGPWWWSEDGWSWVRTGQSAQDWSPSLDRGSPGRRQGLSAANACAQGVSAMANQNGDTWGIQWHLPQAGGMIEVRMVDWPGGELVHRTVLEDALTEGSWTLPTAGQPWPLRSAGQVLCDVRWWAGTCRGRKVWRIPFRKVE